MTKKKQISKASKENENLIRKTLQFEGAQWEWLEAHKALSGESIAGLVREALTEFIINEQDGRTTLAWKEFLRREVHQLIADHIQMSEEKAREDVLAVRESLRQIAEAVGKIAAQDSQYTHAKLQAVSGRLEQLTQALIEARIITRRPPPDPASPRS